VAACVVEFAGGPGTWVTRTYTATAGGGAFFNGQPISASSCSSVAQSLLVGSAAPANPPPPQGLEPGADVCATAPLSPSRAWSAAPPRKIHHLIL
jgi:hypothetical protein